MQKNVNSSSELEPPCRNSPPWGRSKASLVNWITFYWAYDFIKVGCKRALVMDDADSLEQRDTTKYLLQRFLKAWDEQLRRNPNNPSLYKALFQTVGEKYYAFLCLTFVVAGFCLTTNVILLQEILKFIASKGSSNMTDGNSNVSKIASYSQTIGYCFCLLIVQILFTSLSQFIFYNSTRIGINLRQLMIAIILNKTMKISPSSIASSQVTNLISTDSQRFFRLAKLLLVPAGAYPLVVVSIIIVCFRVNLWHPILGICLYLAIVPIQAYFSKKFGKLRDQAVRYTDERLKLIKQVLVGCMTMKMYCWEKALAKSVFENRKNEIKYIQRAALIQAFNLAIYFASQVLVACIIFLPIFYTHGRLNAEDIYPILTFFAVFRLSMVKVPAYLVQYISEINVSMHRFKQFLLIPEICTKEIINIDNVANQTDIQQTTTQTSTLIKIEDKSFSWSYISKIKLKRILTSKKNKISDDNQSRLSTGSQNCDQSPDELTGIISDKSVRHELMDICLNIKKNEFYAVVGKIGSGKSSLLSAILGELPFNRLRTDSNLDADDAEGTFEIHGKIGYAAQQAWIFSGSVKENILFGKKYDSEWYDKVVFACALIEDFKQFPHQDETIIGERGINLSGGQKARVSLARAVYSDTDIYLLDDPLSAVDSIVGKHIFDNLLDNEHGLIKNSIRVLVTHQTQFLNRVDSVVMMDHGKILYNDTFDNLKQQGINIKSLIDHQQQHAQDQQQQKQNEESQSGGIDDQKQQRRDDEMVDDDKQAETQSGDALLKKAQKESIIEEEEMITGKISIATYLSIIYVNSKYFGIKWTYTVQILILIGLTLLILITQCCLTFDEYWLGFWASRSEEKQQYTIYPSIFIVFVIVSLILAMVRAAVFFATFLQGAKHLHDSMFDGVLFAPMKFFHSNPVGRVLNRFSKDMHIVDEMLPGTAFDSIQSLVRCILTMFIATIASPYVVILVIPCAFAFTWAGKSYIANARVLRRLEGVTRSPIYALFGIIYCGLASIRAFDKRPMMLEQAMKMVDVNSRMAIMIEAISRWLAFTLDGIASILTCFTALTCVYIAQHHSNTISVASVGLSLSYLISLATDLQWAVRCAAEAENYMTSTERIDEYKKIPREEKLDQTKSSDLQLADWPKYGNIEIKNLYAKYGEHFDFVLKNICLSIKHNEKIGIVGRTGSGKSSLFLTFFRLLEPDSGCIEIDGINCNKLALYQLRSKLSIIPQTPVLFSETIRYNIDPFNQHSDEEIYNVLKCVKLYDMIKNKYKCSNGIYTLMNENGSNFSVGESQLICVARALLKQSKILLVDEASSSCDLDTDLLIQNILKTKFENRTILTIAHRLQTVLHCDKIIVMQNGTVVEFDTPKNLLAKDFTIDNNACFAKMYHQALMANTNHKH